MSVSITIVLGRDETEAATRGGERVDATATVDEIDVAVSEDPAGVVEGALHSISRMSVAAKSTVNSDDLGWFMMTL